MNKKRANSVSEGMCVKFWRKRVNFTPNCVNFTQWRRASDLT